MTIYTAIFGNYEELKEPTVITPNWKYVCYTDQPITSNVWQIIKMPTPENARRLARRIKILAHEYVSDTKHIWIDASFVIDTNLNDWWSKYMKGSFSAPKHPLTSCVYKEILSCLIGNRGEEQLLRQQEIDYIAMKVPSNNGIIQSGLLMRTRDAECIALCNDWWNELELHSSRDQVAFANISRKYNFNTYVWNYRAEKDFIYKHHYHKRFGNRMPVNLKA